MDEDDALSSYFHHHNELFPIPNPTPTPNDAGPCPSPLLFPRALSGRAPAAHPEPAALKRKRGRPRKYGALSPSPPPSSSSSFSPNPTSSPKKKTAATAAASSNKAQLAALGSAGHGYIPHVIIVAAGEDVNQNIMSFVQQQKRAVCILSACGSISSASIRPPATSGSNLIFEGRFEILSLSGSFLHTETGGASVKTGGLTVCLSSGNGDIVGGGVGGSLMAASPVQVILGSFLIDMEKDTSTSVNMDNTASKMSPPVLPGTTLVSPGSLRSCQESSGRRATNEESDYQQSFGGSGSSYVFYSQEVPVMPSKLPTDWRGSTGHAKAYVSPDVEDEGDFRDY